MNFIWFFIDGDHQIHVWVKSVFPVLGLVFQSRPENSRIWGSIDHYGLKNDLLATDIHPGFTYRTVWNGTAPIMHWKLMKLQTKYSTNLVTESIKLLWAPSSIDCKKTALRLTDKIIYGFSDKRSQNYGWVQMNERQKLWIFRKSSAIYAGQIKCLNGPVRHNRFMAQYSPISRHCCTFFTCF